ncbi:hypothetical protein ACP4OV_001499 [Aristida adscensionis]
MTNPSRVEMANKNAFRLLIVSALAIGLAHSSKPEDQKENIIYNYITTIKKNPPYQIPSVRCIHSLVESDFEAVCGVINKEDEKLISVERLVEIARHFGKRLTPGFRCGTYYIVPPTPPSSPRHSGGTSP